MPTSHHPVVLENVILEVEVLKDEARSLFSSQLFGDRARDQPTQRIDPVSAIGIDGHRTLQARSYLFILEYTAPLYGARFR
jgi:hypothetical protein